MPVGLLPPCLQAKGYASQQINIVIVRVAGEAEDATERRNCTNFFAFSAQLKKHRSWWQISCQSVHPRVGVELHDPQQRPQVGSQGGSPNCRPAASQDCSGQLHITKRAEVMI